ncbi:MAG: galactokinase family protein [Thermoanaerobaculia bacterium]
MTIARLLAEAGLSEPEAARKGALFATLPAAETRLFVPGRIEILGKHTDYAGGRSLLCAVERGFCVAASPREGRLVRLRDVRRGLEAEVRLEAGRAAPENGWVLYAATVARRLAQNFPGPLCGADIAFASDLPRSSGLSSSSALVVAIFSALSNVNRLEDRPEYRANIHGLEDLGGYLGCLENGRTFRGLPGDRGVGTFGGSEDHTAILCCRRGELAQYAFCPVRHERSIPMPAGFTFAVASSGVSADKAGSARDKYNRLSLSAAAILDLWRRKTGRDDDTLLAAATSYSGAPDEILRLLNGAPYPSFDPSFLAGRFTQFIEETTRIIPEAGDALARGDLYAAGMLVERSQELAERLLGNQIPETIFLAREARRLGAAAASAFGAGFGGSVWALVAEADAGAFCERWSAGYASRFPITVPEAEFFATRPGPSLLRL